MIHRQLSGLIITVKAESKVVAVAAVAGTMEITNFTEDAFKSLSLDRARGFFKK